MKKSFVSKRDQNEPNQQETKNMKHTQKKEGWLKKKNKQICIYAYIKVCQFLINMDSYWQILIFIIISIYHIILNIDC